MYVILVYTDAQFGIFDYKFN